MIIITNIIIITTIIIVILIATNSYITIKKNYNDNSDKNNVQNKDYKK